MLRPEITKYFNTTENRNIRDDLTFAVQQVRQPKIAIDCGCGAGADISYLVSNGFTVHGFDVEEEAISRCTTRFKNNNNVTLSLASFGTYTYPKASLIVADASLFFCPKPEFTTVWKKIYKSLYPGGIFCGSFLGEEDTMAGPHYKPDYFWPEVAVFEEEGVRAIFANDEILRFNIHKSSGITPQGEPHDWHIYSVVARKPHTNR